MPAVELTTEGAYGIPYVEMAEGYGETWTPDGCELTRRINVEWAERRLAVLDLVGWTESFPDPATGLLKRWPPNAHPWFDDFVCVSARLSGVLGVPIQDSDGRISIDQRTASGSLAESGAGVGDGRAVYDLSYRRLNFATLDDADTTTELMRYVLRRSRASSESIVIPGQAFAWGELDDTGVPPGTPVPTELAYKAIPGDTTRQIAQGTHVYEWYQLPSLPLENWRAAIGKVNDAQFDEGELDFGPGELYLQSVEWEPKQYASGIFYYDAKLTFLEKPEAGWNKIYSRLKNDFFKVVNTASGTGIYAAADFSSLFRYIA